MINLQFHSVAFHSPGGKEQEKWNLGTTWSRQNTHLFLHIATELVFSAWHGYIATIRFLRWERGLIYPQVNLTLAVCCMRPYPQVRSRVTVSVRSLITDAGSTFDLSFLLYHTVQGRYPGHGHRSVRYTFLILHLKLSLFPNRHSRTDSRRASYECSSSAVC